MSIKSRKCKKTVTLLIKALHYLAIILYFLVKISEIEVLELIVKRI